jgi:hypothetical protein
MALAQTGGMKMRLFKMLGLGLTSAIAALALVGASSAAAENTALCKANEVPCAGGNQITTLHMVNAGAFKLLNSTANIECASTLLKASVGALANPQVVTVQELIWTGCKTVGSATNNCTFTNVALPTIDVLRTGANSGTAKILGLELKVKCVQFGLTTIECVFGREFVLNATGAGGALGNGQFWGVDVEAPAVSGTLCPKAKKWDFGFESLEPIYVST